MIGVSALIEYTLVLCLKHDAACQWQTNSKDLVHSCSYLDCLHSNFGKGVEVSCSDTTACPGPGLALTGNRQTVEGRHMQRSVYSEAGTVALLAPYLRESTSRPCLVCTSNRSAAFQWPPLFSYLDRFSTGSITHIPLVNYLGISPYQC